MPSAIVHIIPIILIVTSGVHRNGVGAGSGNCGQRCGSQAKRPDGASNSVARQGLIYLGKMGTLADSTPDCVMDYF